MKRLRTSKSLASSVVKTIKSRLEKLVQIVLVAEKSKTFMILNRNFYRLEEGKITLKDLEKGNV